MFSCKKLHQNTCSLVFSPFSAYFYPPMDKGPLESPYHITVLFVAKATFCAANVVIGEAGQNRQVLV